MRELWFTKVLGNVLARGHQNSWKPLGLPPAPSPKSSSPDRKVKQRNESSSWTSLHVGYYGNFIPCLWWFNSTIWPWGCWDYSRWDLGSRFHLQLADESLQNSLRILLPIVNAFNAPVKGVVCGPSKVMWSGQVGEQVAHQWSIPPLSSPWANRHFPLQQAF